MRPDMHRSLVIDALEMGRLSAPPTTGRIDLHSDRGSQYAQRGASRSRRPAWHPAFDEPQGQLLG